jgi:hypothetical protein
MLVVSMPEVFMQLLLPPLLYLLDFHLTYASPRGTKEILWSGRFLVKLSIE